MANLNQSAYNPGPIILDIEGLTLNKNDVTRIQHSLTGGVILFGRNFASRQQLTALTKAIKEVRADILICIDHEGGRVQRCKTDGFTHLPPMRRLGELWSKKTSSSATAAITAMKAATACGYVLASELRACGVDFSFTPVLDLNFTHSNVIGDRAIHRQPEIVFALAKSLNSGLRLADMANCGKHFPGHGWAAADSHIAIPVDERTLKEIKADDMKPYEWLDISLASIMPAHVIYPKVDRLPAGFSTIWLQTILRQTLKFNGVIFSDDLSMEGASVAGDVVQGAQLALRAGCDAVLICNRPDLADRLLSELKVNPKQLIQSSKRLKKLFPKANAHTWEALHHEAEYRHAKDQLKTLGLIT
jgi:beta-N-acetylhexosaminidase